MNIYKLMHFHFLSPSGDVKTLGFFSDLLHAKMAKNQYLSLPGFGEHPNGFFVDRIETNIQNVVDTIYEASVVLRNEDYSFELIVFNAIRFERVGAQSALENFMKENELFLKKTNLIVESTVDTYIINDNHWEGGFISE